MRLRGLADWLEGVKLRTLASVLLAACGLAGGAFVFWRSRESDPTLAAQAQAIAFGATAVASVVLLLLGLVCIHRLLGSLKPRASPPPSAPPLVPPPVVPEPDSTPADTVRPTGGGVIARLPGFYLPHAPIPPKPGSRIFGAEGMRISALVTPTKTVLEQIRFEKCQIQGPAVLVAAEDCSFVDCRINEVKGSFLRYYKDEPHPRGAIYLLSCQFIDCSFLNVTFADTADQIDALQKRLGLQR